MWAKTLTNLQNFLQAWLSVYTISIWPKMQSFAFFAAVNDTNFVENFKNIALFLLFYATLPIFAEFFYICQNIDLNFFMAKKLCEFKHQQQRTPNYN